jgi:hypothetical protein
MEKIIVSMASSVYKWLLLPFLALGLTASAPNTVHPFHVSVTEINHNASEKSLEISCKLFTDDFEKILAKNYNTKVDLINPPDKSKMDSLVKQYVLSHLKIKANGRLLTMNYLGYEHEVEAAYSYIEVMNVPSVSKLEITNTLLYDMFDDQLGIMHVTVGGNRKSNKLNYPNQEITVSF